MARWRSTAATAIAVILFTICSIDGTSSTLWIGVRRSASRYYTRGYLWLVGEVSSNAERERECVAVDGMGDVECTRDCLLLSGWALPARREYGREISLYVVLERVGRLAFPRPHEGSSRRLRRPLCTTPKPYGACP